MFGYVNIAQNSVSDDDKKLYQAYYCGLCKAIGKKSQLFRLGLNNELTFLSVLLSAVSKVSPSVLNDKRCFIHPVKTHNEILFDEIMDYTSDMNILLVYLKICDDAEDENNLLYKALQKISGGYIKNVIDKYSEKYKIINENLNILYNLEKQKCSCIDETADCFGKALETIFVPDFIDEMNIKKILSWIGYNIGRWIYILDAYEDMDKDRKNNLYNPILLKDFKNDEEMKNEIDNSLVFSLYNIANAYDLLEIHRNDSILRNILYEGLPNKQRSIIRIGMEEKNGPI